MLGLGYDQCNVFLVRTDAPKFSSSEDALKWLDGKTVAVPKGSCTDRFAQAVFKAKNLKPSEYLNQSIEVITSGFRAKKLDAAVIWEPTASRLVQEGLARRVASGASVNERDGGFMVMPQALIEQRPDVVKAWLEAELDAALFFADSKNAMEIAKMALRPNHWLSGKVAVGIRVRLYAEGGGRHRHSHQTSPLASHLKRLISSKRLPTFLVEIKSIRLKYVPKRSCRSSPQIFSRRVALRRRSVK